MTTPPLFNPATPAPAGPPVFAIASGKGGVGKTSLTLNLATLLARQGKAVLLLDADTGLANLDVQLNLQPEKDVAHVLAGQATLANIALRVDALNPPKGTGRVTLLPGRAGHAGLAEAPLPALMDLIAKAKTFAAEQSYDCVLMDVAAGVAPAQLVFCAAADATLLVTTPDPAALTDAYALVKLLWQQHGTANARVLVNMASAREAEAVAARLNTATKAFLKLNPMPLLGAIPICRDYAAAVRGHRIAAIASPNAKAVEALEKLAKALLA